VQTIRVEAPVSETPDGASLMIGGPLGVGLPERVIDEIERSTGEARSDSDRKRQRFAGRRHWQACGCRTRAEGPTGGAGQCALVVLF
jgi:hypothetical protein